MKKLAMALAFLFAASAGVSALAVESSTATTTKKVVKKKKLSKKAAKKAADQAAKQKAPEQVAAVAPEQAAASLAAQAAAAVPEQAAPVVPEQAAPVVPEQAAPVVAEQAGVVAPEQASDTTKQEVAKPVSVNPVADAPVVAAQAGFVVGMSRDQADAEIGAQLKAGSGLDKIAKEANAAGLNPVQTTELLIKAGQSATEVVVAIIAVNLAAAEDVTSMAIRLSQSGQAGEIAAVAVAAAIKQAPVIAKTPCLAEDKTLCPPEEINNAPSQVSTITKSAIAAAPSQRQSIMTAVLTVPGVNPAELLSATAAGSVPAPAAFTVPNTTPAGAGGRGAASPA